MSKSSWTGALRRSFECSATSSRTLTHGCQVAKPFIISYGPAYVLHRSFLWLRACILRQMFFFVIWKQWIIDPSNEQYCVISDDNNGWKEYKGFFFLFISEELSSTILIGRLRMVHFARSFTSFRTPELSGVVIGGIAHNVKEDIGFL